MIDDKIYMCEKEAICKNKGCAHNIPHPIMYFCDIDCCGTHTAVCIETHKHEVAEMNKAVEKMDRAIK